MEQVAVRPGRTRVRHGRLRLAVLAVLAAAVTTTACSTTTGDDRARRADDRLVCGLLSPDLVHQVVPPGEEELTGGIRSAAQRKVQPAECTVADARTTTTKIQVSIGEVTDPARWRSTLAREAGTASGVAEKYTGDPGDGYGSTYDQGVDVDGASVYVVRGDRLVRATVSHWTDATPQERLALAEKMVVDLDRNVTAHDRGRG